MREQRRFTVTGLDLSGYMVKDARRAIAFYRDVLGLEPTKVYPEDRGAEYELPDGTVFVTAFYLRSTTWMRQSRL
jgi:catechol 2,3-dioxygenase-like lactoylglutathione lyase family enzyme